MLRLWVLFVGCVLVLNAQIEHENLILNNKLELFIDSHMIEEKNNVDLIFHNPIKQKKSKHPLKKSPYMTIIKVHKNHYIAYYSANNKKYKGINKTGYPNKLTKYAISKDGKNWKFPKKNIIIKEPPFTHNFSPFLDRHESLDKDERFKALAGVDDNLLKRLRKTPPTKENKSLKETLHYWGYPEGYESGLYSFVSKDGIHWRRKSKKPVITVAKNIKAFDSQNVSFWSKEENCYVCFYRSWGKEMNKKTKKEYWVRQISKTTSKDFIHWSKPVKIKANLIGEQLYTTQTHPYFRAPHIYIALPTRFMSHRKGLTDIMLMSMRAGNNNFDRVLKEAYIKPGLSKKRWENRANYTALNVVPTGTQELSIYHSRSGDRYTLRTDGFASVHAGHKKGFLLTKVFIFNGKNLYLNYSTSAAGKLRVEIEDITGKTVAKSKILVGDSVGQRVAWKKIKNLKKLRGKRVRLKFLIKECDLYSFKFGE